MIDGVPKGAVCDMVNGQCVVVTDVDTFVQAYKLSGGSVWVIICYPYSRHLLPKDDCSITPGIRTSHHIEWFNGKLELSTYSHFTLGKDGSLSWIYTFYAVTCRHTA